MAETAAAESSPAVPDYLASPNAVFADKGVQWRYGRPPDYSKTRKVWEEGKKSNHAAGSLPQLVENLVKNWEVEASFKSRLEDWRTIDHANYTFSMGGGPPQSAEHMLKVGTYNAIIAPNEYYDPSNSDFASSHKTFKRMMPTFAWEVMEVYRGPPVVAFKWRHWGTMKNDYVGFNNKGEKVTAKAHGGPIEIFGVTIANVDDKVRLQAVDTWMDPLEMFRQIAPHGIVNKEPMNRKAEKAEALDDGPGHNGVNIAEEYNNGDARSQVDQSAGADIPKHISEKTGLPADAPDHGVGGCPFMGRTGTSSASSLPEDHPAVHIINGTSETNDTHSNGINGSGSVHAVAAHDGSNGTDVVDPLETPAPARYTNAAGQTFVRSEDTKQPVAEITSVGSDGSTRSSDSSPIGHSFTLAPGNTAMNSASTATPALHDAAMDVDVFPSAVVGDADLSTLNNGNSTVATGSAAGQETGMNVDQHPNKRAAEEDIPRSLYSSSVTGDVENVIKAARSGDYVDESIATGTHDAVDTHSESSANEVHPHPKTMEEEVKPDPGEAVAVSANTDETQQTYKEMSDIKPEEKELVMNRE